MRNSSYDDERTGNLLVHLAAGLAGGLAGAFAMERLQYAIGALFPDAGGVSGGGGQQHRQPESEPATYQAADALVAAATGHAVPTEYKPAAGSLVHYAFGGAVGAIYGVAAARTPNVAAFGGLPFGVAVWIAADEIGVPVTGLSKPPTEYPLRDHVSALAAHVAFGLTTECVRKSLLHLGERRPAGFDAARRGGGGRGEPLSQEP